MDRHAGSSLTLQGVRAKRTAPKDPSAIVGDSLNEAGPADRDPSSCSVRCNTLESPVPQPASALGPSRGGSGSLLGNSPFDIGHIAETAADEDAAPRNSDHGGSAEISRSGSWPGLMVDDLDSMFECMLNLRNLKGSVESKESRHVGSQRLSRYVEAVSRTSSRRSGRWSPKRSTASPLGDQSAREKKVALWIQLIKGLRMKRWTQLLATVNKKEPSDKAAAKGAEKVAESGVKHACTVVEIVCDASAARDSDERGVAPEEKVMSSVDAAKQYARFRPRSVANDAKHEPLSSIRGVSNTFAPSAAVRRGYMSDVDAVNYGLVRIREAGVSHQVYDCVEKETGRMLSVKLIPRDHGAAELYEQLCESGHENFISVVQILEDARLFYILMDFDNSMYLKEFYHSSHPKTFTEAMLKSIVRNLLAAMAYLHKRGLVVAGLNMDSVTIHRLADGEVVAKISNLDNVCAARCRPADAAQLGAFEAPELGEEALTCSSDIWSLGVLLYMLAEGRPPFKSYTTSSYAGRTAAVKATRLAFTSERWADAPSMKDFCVRCLQADHRQRISSAMEAFIHPWVRG